jgi:hypothetical protein
MMREFAGVRRRSQVFVRVRTVEKRAAASDGGIQPTCRTAGEAAVSVAEEMVLRSAIHVQSCVSSGDEQRLYL